MENLSSRNPAEMAIRNASAAPNSTASIRLTGPSDCMVFYPAGSADFRSENAMRLPDFLAQHEIQIAQIDKQAEPLPRDEHRVAAVERIGKQQHAAGDREDPERGRND